MITSATWPALGTSAGVYVTDTRTIAAARTLVDSELQEIDSACSRFRSDSELSRANARAGEPFPASDLFLEAVEVALDVARATDGAVDPTVGRAMRNIGYDRDFALLYADAPEPAPLPASPGWPRVHVEREAKTVHIPAGVELDLGATAKALAADRAAHRAHRALGCGVLVSLGGDIAVAGNPPRGGWRVGISDDHRDAAEVPAQTVSIAAGGLATSSTAVRRWRAGGRAVHHIVDPRTGASAPEVWRTVSVAARSCIDANGASTASIVRGTAAPIWLAGLGMPSRLVNVDGRVLRVAGWPEPQRR